jgi:hypothetical protein
MEQQYWDQIECLLDAAPHSEHGQAIKRDVLTRSNEISRVIYCAILIFRDVMEMYVHWCNFWHS